MDLQTQLSIPSIDGLIYEPDFLDQTAIDQLLTNIDAAPWRDDLQRRVQHYGYRYDYKARAVRPGDYLGPLPDWALGLARRMQADGYFINVPDQVIVNEYLPGQGIAAHVDCEPCFGPVIASISLGSAAVMEFTALATGGRQAVMLKPGSLVVLSGDARYAWKHGIPARKTDPGPYGRVPRARRVSLTFRNMVLAD